MDIEHIVVAVDGSVHADRATDVALALALARSASVTFVHFSPLAQELFEANPEAGPDQEEIARRDEVLRRAREAAGRAGVPCALEIADERGSSDIAAAIAGIAEGLRAQIVVAGARGRGGLATAVLGSVSHELARIATIPVLTVHVPAGN